MNSSADEESIMISTNLLVVTAGASSVGEQHIIVATTDSSSLPAGSSECFTAAQRAVGVAADAFAKEVQSGESADDTFLGDESVMADMSSQ